MSFNTYLKYNQLNGKYIRKNNYIIKNNTVEFIDTTVVNDTEYSYKIWIQRSDEVYLWKEFLSTLPISLEFNINF